MILLRSEDQNEFTGGFLESGIAAGTMSANLNNGSRLLVSDADSEQPGDAGLDHSKHSSVTEEREGHLFAFAVACLSNGQPLNRLTPEAQLACAVVLTVIMLLGAVCNCALFVCMLRFGYSRVGACLHVSAIAAADLVLLTVRCGDLWLRCALGVSPVSSLLTQSKTACCVFPFAYGCVLHMRGFAHLALAWDTVSLYWHPVTAWQRLKPERVGNTLIAFCAAFLVINSQYLWTYSLQDVRFEGGELKESLCTVASTWIAPWWRNTIWPLTDFAITDFLPIAFVTVSGLASAGCAMRHAAASQPHQPALASEATTADGSKTAGRRNLTTTPDSELSIEDKMTKYIIDHRTFKQLRLGFLTLSLMFVAAAVPETVSYVANFLSYSSIRVSIRLAGRQTLARAAPDLALGQDAERLWLELGCRFFTFICMSLKLLPFLVCCPAVRRSVARMLSPGCCFRRGARRQSSRFRAVHHS